MRFFLKENKLSRSRKNIMMKTIKMRGRWQDLSGPLELQQDWLWAFQPWPAHRISDVMSLTLQHPWFTLGTKSLIYLSSFEIWDFYVNLKRSPLALRALPLQGEQSLIPLSNQESASAIIPGKSVVQTNKQTKNVLLLPPLLINNRLHSLGLC